MATVSRHIPPCAAVITIIPAVGGPSSTTFHSSGERLPSSSWHAPALHRGRGPHQRVPRPAALRLTPRGVRRPFTLHVGHPGARLAPGRGYSPTVSNHR